VPAAQVVEVVVAVQVPAAGFLVAEPKVERRGARVVVGDAEPGLMAAAVASQGLGGADDSCPGAPGAPRRGPHVQAVELGTARVPLVHLGCGASGPEDFTLADRNASATIAGVS
jgi:hypothetical protein